MVSGTEALLETRRCVAPRPKRIVVAVAGQRVIELGSVRFWICLVSVAGADVCLPPAVFI